MSATDPTKDPLGSSFVFEKATRSRFKPGDLLDGIARSVLLQMASHRHWKSRGTITTKAETIALETGFSERAVADRIKRLEAAGWLVRVRGKQGGTVEYDVAVPVATSASRAELKVETSAPRAESPLHHTQKNSDEQVLEASEHDSTPSGEGPTSGEIPTKFAGPRRVRGIGIPAEELMIPDSGCDDERLDIAAVALARDHFSQHDDVAVEQVRRIVHRSDPEAVLALVRSADGCGDGWEDAVHSVVDLLDSLNTQGTVSAG